MHCHLLLFNRVLTSFSFSFISNFVPAVGKCPCVTVGRRQLKSREQNLLSKLGRCFACTYWKGYPDYLRPGYDSGTIHYFPLSPLSQGARSTVHQANHPSSAKAWLWSQRGGNGTCHCRVWWHLI
ncbi:hypothetical protein F5Y13DRAFT_69881 [Hypoxylon sp. FL1857]|nr:hypothetical protein F5Y13DRAFT_69881 [Hypoxylon sp. FL1857]